MACLPDQIPRGSPARHGDVMKFTKIEKDASSMVQAKRVLSTPRQTVPKTHPAQATVTNIVKTPAAHEDKTLLAFAGQWHVARNQAKLVWANIELDSAFGTVPGNNLEGASQYLDKMREIEGHLASWKPCTTLGAHVLLDVAAQILLSRIEDPDPEIMLSKGPVLEIIQNVSCVLGARDKPLKHFPD